MAESTQTLLAAGGEALSQGEWEMARDSFEAVVDDEKSAEAMMGLGQALWWLGDLDRAIASREGAYAEFRRRGEPRSAFPAAMQLCIDYHSYVGNTAASAGWLARATRLVEDFDVDDMRGWLRFIQAYQSADPIQGEVWARQALKIAKASGDLDLELCALSELGAHVIKQGRIEQGIAYLDEAMAGSLGGEYELPETVVLASCNMIVSCMECAEFQRAVHWLRASERFADDHGCQFLYAECRIVYGNVLVATGAWEKAEEELTEALEVSRGSVPVFHTRALSGLAELRLLQGRYGDARRLISLGMDHAVSVPIIARLHLIDSRPDAAVAVLKRQLEVMGDDRLESGILIELLGEAEIMRGQIDAAEAQARALSELAETRQCPINAARAERLLGRALAVLDRRSEAGSHLNRALSEFATLEMPYDVARTRILIAENESLENPVVAEVEAGIALDAFESLGARRDADEAKALLRRLGVRVTRPGAREMGVLTGREREVLALLGEGHSNPEIADRLYISRKTVEHHVSRVLAKLGLRSRTEAAVMVTRQGPGEAS